MTGHKLPPLYLRTLAEEVPASRFDGDRFGRAKLAERLTGFLSRLPDGAVMAIDSPWGEGKTWFGKRWCASLNDAGFQTAYVDCFQRDHLDDPFTMIAGEFIELAKAGKPEVEVRLWEAGKKLGVALLPAAARFAVNTIGHLAIGKANLSEDITNALDGVDDSVSEALEELVSSHLTEYQASKKSLEAFKQTLAELTVESEKPIVIFLDELDRCRPDFAVRTIERVKHFFDVPGVIFVLLLNRRQMNAAVEGLYGPKVDADAYLSKFIPISLTLPKKLSVDRHGDDDNRKHCKSELTRFGFAMTEANNGFSGMLGIYATLFGFSLRDVERAVVLYSFAQPLDSAAAASAWPIALRLHKPELYKRLCLHDPSAHKEAKELAASLKLAAPHAEWSLSFFESLHQSGATQFKEPVNADTTQILMSQNRWGEPKDYLTWLFGRVDLSVAE